MITAILTIIFIISSVMVAYDMGQKRGRSEVPIYTQAQDEAAYRRGRYQGLREGWHDAEKLNSKEFWNRTDKRANKPKDWIYPKASDY